MQRFSLVLVVSTLFAGAAFADDLKVKRASLQATCYAVVLGRYTGGDTKVPGILQDEDGDHPWLILDSTFQLEGELEELRGWLWMHQRNGFPQGIGQLCDEAFGSLGKRGRKLLVSGIFEDKLDKMKGFWVVAASGEAIDWAFLPHTTRNSAAQYAVKRMRELHGKPLTVRSAQKRFYFSGPLKKFSGPLNKKFSGPLKKR